MNKCARGQWCILRTGGSRTLPLVRSLAGVGLDVWTPIAMTERRKGRSRVRVEAAAPILPTFVFARADDLSELLAIETALTSQHPQFSLFRYAGRIALIADAELAQLRTEESRAALARRRKERHVFEKGARVTVPDGAFTGLTGIVEDGGNGKFTLVIFNQLPIRIASFLLKADDVQKAKPIKGIAAQVAALTGRVAEPPLSPTAGSSASGTVRRNPR